MSDRVHLTPHPGELKVRAAGTVIVETRRAVVVHETGLPPRYYVPREDVRADIAVGQGAGTCPWKGEWRHLDVTVAGERIANAAWTYFATTPVCDPVKDFVAFYPEKVELIG
jgi:uncharacterized protein (DUF427 family)